ncbi:MAG: SMC-Scp complex subunit ScpB [Elusimicrobia bacterium CG11_big_fil_rev_8_21_14_0_20_64_6]|nr:MAG: SMC-Scp complex subunit ScpB [Elusimicrobia bacterium CG11_big_fil_rev_8_21_14_0_20_64_6]
METLAIVAYRQPVTKADIDTIRGVDVGAALDTLLERNLVKVTGRKDTPGRPFLYGTTAEFLRLFGLKSLEGLPPMGLPAIPEQDSAEASPAPAEAAAPAAAPPDGSSA